jgi:hypothetical protein
MCFSAEASFTVGAALAPAGAYCLKSAFQKNTALVPLALVPIAFGLQQLSEGMVWLGIHSQDPALIQKAAVFFLFFAIPFWPFWIPISLLCMECRKSVRYILGGLALLSLVWMWFSYPLLVKPDEWLTTRQVHHSIQYDFDTLPAFQVMSQTVWRNLYLAAIVAPFLVRGRGQSGKSHLVGGIAVAVFFLVAYLLFWYAFTSVWCFFAAVLSLYLCYVFYRQPGPAPARLPQTAPSGTPLRLAK